MDLVPIFVDEATGEGIYAMRYDNNLSDEFERLFEDWNDVQFVSKYCLSNQPYLQTTYFTKFAINEIIEKILSEAKILEDLIYDYAESGFDNAGNNLQMLFK